MFIVLGAVLSLIAVISIYREGGILKRLRATPLRPQTILSAHVVVKLIMSTVTLGLLVVVVFGAVAIYFFTKSVLVAWGVLAAAVVVDLVIYFFTKTVTTCYNCRADYRKYAPNPDHEGFDLATSEKY